MRTRKTGSACPCRERGFTLVEMLVAGALSALFMTAAALTYAAIVEGRDENHSFGRVEVGAANLQAFYGANAPTDGAGNVLSSRNLPWAPNYAKAAELEILRDIFWEDVNSAVAVFSLPRAGVNTYHPDTIALPLTVDARMIDSPARFYDLVNTASPGTFTSFRGASPAAAPNGSVFVLHLSPDKDDLNVYSIYDIDFVTTSSPPGVYVSIRRYEGDSVTVPYEIFYPSDGGTQSFTPLFVAFERSGRKINTDAYDAFKVAEEKPFQFMWWPDPVDKHLEVMPNGAVAAATAGTPRAAYQAMSGRTAFLFVFPTFPAL